jgi:adenylosuccinate synthase
LDLVLLRYASRISGFSALAVTRLDVLSGLKEIGIGVKYLHRGQEIAEIGANTNLAEAKPVIEVFPGWQEDLSECRKWEDLPKRARDFIGFLETSLEIPVVLLSVGPSREQTIVLRKDLLF